MYKLAKPLCVFLVSPIGLRLSFAANFLAGKIAAITLNIFLAKQLKYLQGEMAKNLRYELTTLLFPRTIVLEIDRETLKNNSK